MRAPFGSPPRGWASCPIAAAFVVTACGRAAEAPQVTELAVAAPSGSATPRLVAADPGELVLSWTEPAGEGHALRWVRLSQRGATAPQTAASGRDWLINWADFSSVTSLSKAELVAHWLVRRRTAAGERGAGYDVRFARSRDGGATWSAPWSPHADGTDTEHGFVSVVPRDGGAIALWLDGRAFAGLAHDEAEARGAMQLRAMRLVGEAPPADETSTAVVDARTCSCCQTTAVAVGADVLVAYRDRTEAEVRDISVARLTDGTWSAPRTLFADGWRIDGCPVNGPAAAASGARVAVAWYTEAAGRPAVKLALSADGGHTFGSPVRLDDGRPQGRVATVFAASHVAVLWQEIVGPAIELRLRWVTLEGRVVATRTLATVAAGRASGFPQLGVLGDDLVVAYTDADAGGAAHVRVLRVRQPS